MRRYTGILFALITSIVSWAAKAEDFYWKGAEDGTGLWFNGDMWESGKAPSRTQGNAAQIVIVNGMCEYVPGGDWEPNCDVTIGTGGKWFQSSGVAWIYVHGTLTVQDGGVLDSGTAGRFRCNGTMTVKNGGQIILRTGVAQGGTVNLESGGEILLAGTQSYTPEDGAWRLVFNGGKVVAEGNYNDSQTYTDYASYGIAYTDGAIEKFGRFIFSRDVVLNGGTIDVGLIKSDSGAHQMILSAGTLKVDATAWSNGFEANGGTINFPLDSTAQLVIRNANAEAVAEKFLTTEKKIAIGGELVDAAAMANRFIVEYDAETETTTLSLKAVEGLPVFGNDGAVVIEEAAPALVPDMIVTAVVEDAGDTATTATLVYGTVNGGMASISDWQHVINLGTVTAGQTLSAVIPQTANQELYYNIVLQNAAGAVWGRPNQNPVPFLKIWTWRGEDEESDNWATEGHWTPGGYPWIGNTTTRAQITRGTCHWNSGDFTWGGYLYIENAKLYQTSGSWESINGTVEIGEGGEYDGGPADSFRLSGRIIVHDGGKLLVQKNLNNDGVIQIEEGGILEMGANLRSYSGDTSNRPTLDFAGTIDVAGTFLALSKDVFTNGTVRANEFRVQKDRPLTFEGTDFVVTKLALNANLVVKAGTVVVDEYIGDDNGGDVISFEGGTIELATAGTHDAQGYWRKDGTSGYIDFVAQSAGELVLGGGFDASMVYDTYFAGATPRCRYMGVAITRASFEKNFEVTTDTNEKVHVTYNPTDDVPVFGNTGAITVEQTAGGIRIQGLIEKAGEPAATLYLVWGDTDKKIDADAWAHRETVAATVEADMAIDYTFTPDSLVPVYWGLYLDNGSELVWASPESSLVMFGGKVFNGLVSSDVSEDGNWWPLGAPSASDAVVVVTGKGKNAIWNEEATHTVAKLVKTGAGTLELMTTLDNPLVIAGDFDLREGVVSAKNDQSRLDPWVVAINVGGDLTVTAGAQLDANTRAVWHGGPFYTTEKQGASYAGEGGRITGDYSDCVTWGSVTDPLSVGTSVQGDNNSYRAGGLVKLTVAGALKVDGTVSADGFGWPSIWGGSSGGSVNITAAALSGAGVISANGGRDYDLGSGSGGRIKVRLTGEGEDFTSFTGAITAYCHDTNMIEWRHIGAAGTVFLQTAAQTEGEGTIVVDNENYTLQEPTEANPFRNAVPATHLPAMHASNPVNNGRGIFSFPTDAKGNELVEDLSKTDWIVKGKNACVKLTKPRFVIRTLSIVDGAKVDLNGKTLRLAKLTVDGVKVHLPATSEKYPAILIGDGEIVSSSSLAIVIR